MIVRLPELAEKLLTPPGRGGVRLSGPEAQLLVRLLRELAWRRRKAGDA